MTVTKLRARLLSGTMLLVGMVAATGATAQDTTTAPVQTPVETPAASQTPAPAAAPQASGEQAEGDQAGGNSIVVVGNRYQATGLQMRSNNTVNVLSANDLAHTAVHNVAEALGLLPGINVMNTGSSFIGGVDGASRGEGMFVSVRGLNSEYNINQINGVDVAQGNPYSRGVQLSLLPPSGLQTIVLNKTSRADMDGDAIGGTVDFRTPSAFDYAGKFNASVQGGGRIESRARDYGKSGLGYSVAGDISDKFGPDDQFGIYVSGFYDIRNFDNSLVGGVAESGCCDRGWDFAVQGPGTADQRQNSAAGIDPVKNLLLTGANFGVSTGFTKRYGGNASFNWRPDDDTSFYIRGTYAKAITRQDSHLTQIVGSEKQDGSDGQALGNGTYAPIIGTAGTRFWYETNPELATLGTLQAGGQKRFGNLTLTPNVFYSWGRNDRPDHIEVAVRTRDINGGGDGLPYGGTSLFTYSKNFPFPTLTAAQNAALNDIPGMPTTGGSPELTAQRSGQRKGGVKFDAKYDFGESRNYIQAGFKFQDSERYLTNRDWTVPSYGSATTFGQLGIISSQFPDVFPGKYGQPVPDIDQAKLFALFNQLGGATAATIDTCGSGSAVAAINSYNCNTQKAQEFVASGYIEASFNFGNLEILPGIRYEHSEINNRFWLTPSVEGETQVGHFSTNATVYNKALPSIFFNYRPDSRAVYRASVWTSYVRPPFLYLGGGSNTSVSGPLTTVTVGNPDLKPITSLNVDASGEWDFATGTHVLLAGFYKRLHHYIYDNGSNAGVIDTVNGGITSGTITKQPSNGGSGSVYGVEASFRQTFTMLPGLLSGLGVAGNVTRQWTKVDLFGDGSVIDRIQNAPDWLGNAQLFFEKGPVSFDMNYTYSGAYVQTYDQLGFGQFGLDPKLDDIWVRPVGRLDLHVGYTFNRHLKIDGSVSNVLGSYSYWSHIGEHSLAISDIVDSGTTSLVTATVKF